MAKKNKVKKKISYDFPEEVEYKKRIEQEKKEELNPNNKTVRSNNVDYLKRKALQQGQVLLKDDKTKRATQQKLQVGQQFSKEQNLLRDLFSNPDNAILFMNPYSECQTKLNGAIIPHRVNGYPIDDYTSADMFGFGNMPKETRSLFLP